MAEEKINRNPWISVELADAVGMATNPVSPSMKTARLIQNLQSHIKSGMLKTRPGYTLKYALPSDSSIYYDPADTTKGFLNFHTFTDKQADPEGKEITCLIQKGTISAISGSGVADTQNMLCFWVSHSWNGTAWVEGWQWINKTIITKVTTGSDVTYPNMIYFFGTGGYGVNGLIGWTIYNKTKDQYAKIIATQISAGNTVVQHTAYTSNWEVDDVLIICKNFVDLTAMQELYDNLTWDEIQFHTVLNDLRIGFGGKENRPGLMVGYRKNYLMLSEFDFTNLHSEINASVTELFSTTDGVILTTAIADRNAYGIDLNAVAGSIAANTYYFRLTGLLDGYMEQLLAENQITVAGGDDDIEIYPFAYINKLDPRITEFNIYKSTNNSVFYKIKSNTIRSSEFSNTVWKIDEQGKYIYVKDADLIKDENAATPTSDFDSIGDWTAQYLWGCTFESEDDDIGLLDTVTMTVASPCVVTKNNHGLSDGQKIRFYTTGALPTGIIADTDYFVKEIGINTFNIAATQGGTNIDTTGTQSGVHSIKSGLRTPQNGSYFLLWKSIQGFSMIMKLTSGVITYKTQKVSLSFYAKTNVDGITLKIGSISPYPNPFGEPVIEYQEVSLSNDGDWHLHTVTMDIYGKIVFEANGSSSGNVITRIGIDNIVVQISDYLLSGLDNGAEMKSELGYNPTFNLVKGWDQALVYRGRTFYLNPYVEKRYENYILKSHIHSNGSFMYDIASFGEYGEIEKFDSNECVGMIILPTGSLLILKDRSALIVDTETLSPTEPVYWISCKSKNTIVDINGVIRWCGDEDIYVYAIGGGGIKGILNETIRDLYLAITDKTKLQAVRDKFNTYRVRIYDTTNKTEYLLTENGWVREVRNLFPQVYRQGENNRIYFLNAGNIYLVDEA